ncbi:MAG: Na+/H+ antiporter NhaC [Clostridiales bacterium]|nr:Na+/H+ antiporter NhaC [Candidatus Crickella merdequi]
MSKNEKEIITPKKPGLILSLIPIVAVFLMLYMSLTSWGLDIQIPLIFAAIIAAFIAVVCLKVRWQDLEKGIIDSITSAMQAILIACLIGLIVGSWIAGGIVPSLVYYGLKILSPKFFLVTCLLVCSIVAITTGSSWTTAGTLGVAMLGIGTSMGIPPAVTAGCVVSAAYFGDKMSPFSDTTNLAPAVSGTTLFAHIRHMMYTAGTSYVLAIIGFMILNTRYSGGAQQVTQIAEVSAAIKEEFVVSPWLMLPLLILLLLIYFKIPAIPGLVASMIIGAGCAIFVQGTDIATIGTVLSYGYECNSSNEMLVELFTKGGLQNMMWTISLILCSLTFGGVMYTSGMLETIAQSILKLAKGTLGLVACTGFTALLVNLVCGEQYLSILITGKMYREEYENRNLAPQNLSRTLEDFGTITSPLIPWTTCAVAMATYLGVSTLEYLPYCFLNIVNPIVALVFAAIGFTIKKRDEVSPEDLVE